jgi:hypothetical protein
MDTSTKIEESTKIKDEVPSIETNEEEKSVVVDSNDNMDGLLQAVIFSGNFVNICALIYLPVVPILSLILYFDWKDRKPNSANQLCKMTWMPVAIAFGIFAVCGIAYIALRLITAANSSSRFN